VRLTERYLKHSPPLPEELQSARTVIVEELSQVRNPGFISYKFIGVAGTATTLACLDQQLIEFEVAKVAGYQLHVDRVVLWLTKLLSLDSSSIRRLSNATEGRADILTAGVLILHECMKHFQFSSILVSERGLRYGLIQREWERIEKRSQ
jgi:exopolyphosphatase/guanosine-5'-triphosphate,3'-diphosphate pyrophosphatase